MKKILKYSFIGLAALCTALLCGGYYMLGHALNPDELITRSRNSQASYEYMFGQYPELKPWVDSLQTAGALRDFYIKNDRGETLHALYVAAAEPTRKTAVIVHGYTDNSIRMLNIGYLYNRQLKYNILLPDLHGHGASEGAEIQMGWLDRLDVLQWTATADELFGRNNETVTAGDSTRMRSSGTEMVVHGISMGAATTMMVSGEVEHGIHQQPFIKCFVEDCGYTSVWDEFRGELKAQYGLPAFPLKCTGYAAVAHLVERHLAKVEVASSSLVGRSNTKPSLMQKCKSDGFFVLCGNGRECSPIAKAKSRRTTRCTAALLTI